MVVTDKRGNGMHKTPYSDGQLDTLRHMLGINDPRRREPKPYRNYAAVTPGDPQFIALEALGAVERYKPRIDSEYHWYRCTDVGKQAALHSHRTIRWGASKRRYSCFLHIREALPELTFTEFLTDPEFAEVRRSA